MGKITELEVGKFVSLFNRGGYVLNFTTNEFDVFTMESVGVAVCAKYGLSKGKSLIAFLSDADDNQKMKLLSDLFDYYENEYMSQFEWNDNNTAIKYKNLYFECRQILNRIRNSNITISANILKDQFSSEYITEQINLMVDMQEKNPTEAIGKAKELIESCCKTILDEHKVNWDKTWDVNKLSGQTMLCLGLMPEKIDDQHPAANIAKALLGNLQQVAIRMAELRNPFGSGHGKSASFQALPPRYARLAVGASVTLTRFLWDTHEERD